jgi:hypothetical protein
MSDPNPYEPPRSLEPLTKGQVVKRGIGVALILLATPPAIVIAVAVSCTAGDYFLNIPPILMFSMPLIVLSALMGWAAFLDRPKRGEPNRTQGRVGIFLSTPLVVAIATAVGFAIAVPVFFATGGPGYGIRLWMVLAAFWLPPGVTLLAMLWLAWRAG